MAQEMLGSGVKQLERGPCQFRCESLLHPVSNHQFQDTCTINHALFGPLHTLQLHRGSRPTAGAIVNVAVPWLSRRRTVWLSGGQGLRSLGFRAFGVQGLGAFEGREFRRIRVSGSDRRPWR